MVANIPYLDAQQLKFGLTLIRNTRDFERNLGKWKTKLAVDKAWANLSNNLKTPMQTLRRSLDSGWKNRVSPRKHACCAAAREYGIPQHRHTCYGSRFHGGCHRARTHTITHHIHRTKRKTQCLKTMIKLEILRILKDVQRDMQLASPAYCNGEGKGGGGCGQQKCRRNY